MKITITSKCLLILSVLFFITACTLNTVGVKNTPAINYLSNQSMVAYKKGEGVLLFSFRKDTQDTEAYSDWAEYLNDFKSNTGSSFSIFEITSKEKLTLNRDLQDFSVFLKKGYPSYLYDGLIVEPQVYSAVYKIYTNQKLSHMDKSFLPEPLCKFKSDKKTC
jgi:hypothetical protein